MPSLKHTNVAEDCVIRDVQSSVGSLVEIVERLDGELTAALAAFEEAQKEIKVLQEAADERETTLAETRARLAEVEVLMAQACQN